MMQISQHPGLGSLICSKDVWSESGPHYGIQVVNHNAIRCVCSRSYMHPDDVSGVRVYGTVDLDAKVSELAVAIGRP